MGSDDSVIFCQDGFMPLSFSSFVKMRGKEELIDFKIRFQNRSIVGHRVILAAAIPYFHTIFASFEEEITLKEIEPDALQSIIDFVYCGQIKITSENVRSLLVTSEFLQVTQIRDACSEYLGKRLYLNNVWEIRQLAENFSCLKLLCIADHYIRKNFEAFSKSENFLTLPFSYFKKVISKDNLNISAEKHVFEAVVRWVEVSPSERKDLLPELLAAVRMTYLDPDFLVERVLSEELIRTSLLCRDLVDEANLYHWFPEKRSKIRNLTIRPRITEKKLQEAMVSSSINGYSMYAICESSSELSVKLLDLVKGEWINLSNFKGKPIHKVVAFHGLIYIFLKETILKFDIKTLKWHFLDTVHEDLYFSGIVVHEERIYIFGGLQKLGKVSCFDPRLNKWLNERKMIRARHDTGAASLADYIYITGGGWNRTAFNYVDRYNPQTKEWQKISPMLTERYCHGCTSMNGKIYVCGGFNGGCLNTAEVYDPLTNHWNSVSPMKLQIQELSLIPHDGKLYALGRRKEDYTPGVVTEIYDPESDEWEFGIPISDDCKCDIFLVSAAIPSKNNKILRRIQWDPTRFLHHLHH